MCGAPGEAVTARVSAPVGVQPGVWRAWSQPGSALLGRGARGEAEGNEDKLEPAGTFVCAAVPHRTVVTSGEGWHLLPVAFQVSHPHVLEPVLPQNHQDRGLWELQFCIN